MKRPIRVMIVEDSLVAQKILLRILAADKALNVVAVASSGEEALAQLAQISPDLITMDVHLPGLDGLAVTRKIMETRPVPIVVVSASCLVEDAERAYQLIEAGALAAVAKPISMGDDYASNSARLIQTIKDMAAVKVIKRWPKKSLSNAIAHVPASGSLSAEIKIVAIGASTGGPPVVETILKDLPEDFPAAVVLVQHIAPGFLSGMVEWLQHSLKLRVKIAADGEKLQNGFVYLSEENKHIGVKGKNIVLSDGLIADGGHRPSISHLFKSLAETDAQICMALLLTGMGSDGAEELLALKEKGATTIVQDKESSVVYGMPRAAVAIGAETYVMKPAAMAALLLSLHSTRLRSES